MREIRVYKLNMIELILYLLIGVITIIINFFVNIPIPLLGIPFLIIITMRSIFINLEDSETHRKTK